MTDDEKAWATIMANAKGWDTEDVPGQFTRHSIPLAMLITRINMAKKIAKNIKPIESHVYLKISKSLYEYIQNQDFFDFDQPLVVEYDKMIADMDELRRQIRELEDDINCRDNEIRYLENHIDMEN